MVISGTPARAGRYMALGLLRATQCATRAVAGNRAWRVHMRPHGWELHGDLNTALTAGFFAACAGLLAVLALRGYTIYG